MISDQVNCKICNSKNTSFFEAKETMFGLNGTFIYISCNNCGCLFLKNIPDDYSYFYPTEYYSMTPPPPITSFSDSLKRIKRSARNRYYYFSTGALGWLLAKIKNPPPYHISRHIKLNEETSILDVGCGSGTFLSELAEIGVRHTHGLDPFVAKSTALESGLRIFKGDLKQFQSDIPFGIAQYDFIRFSHSFEHLANPLETLQTAKLLLKPSGKIIINIPMADSHAAQTYKENWVQLDAPRHIFLLSKKSTSILAAQAGLKIEDTFYDSTGFQFWGSEQCIRGIPLHSEKSVSNSKKKSIFSRSQLKAYDLEASKLNAIGEGDQACFILSLQ